MVDVPKAVIEIPKERLEEATAVLAAAFHDDPAMQWLLEHTTAGYEDSLNELMRFSCLVRLHLQWPLFGVEDGGRLIGVLGVSMPDEANWPETLQKVYANIGDVLGAEAVGRLEEYSRLADSARPKERHYHVGMVGVSPKAQGRGLGRTLLSAVHAMSEKDALSAGVALDTENPESRRFYEANGYKCTSELSINGVRIWNMFRPNS